MSNQEFERFSALAGYRIWTSRHSCMRLRLPERIVSETGALRHVFDQIYLSNFKSCCKPHIVIWKWIINRNTIRFTVKVEIIQGGTTQASQALSMSIPFGKNVTLNQKRRSTGFFEVTSSTCVEENKYKKAKLQHIYHWTMSKHLLWFRAQFFV